MGSEKSRAVDLVINTFERTYRTILSPGFFPRIEAQNLRPFERKVALINNVLDVQDARSRAERLVGLGELDAHYVVAEHIDRALTQVGLVRKDLGRAPHFTDCALVAVTVSKGPYLLYWDAEVKLQEACNWIDPAIQLLEQDNRILVANPNWKLPTLDRETLETTGEFVLGYGFSDQLFLVRRDELARPIYKCFCPASLRYPMAHTAAIFELRVDAYMRTHRRLRATYTRAVYEHPESEGALYPAAGWAERVRFFRNKLLVKILRHVPTSSPYWRV